MKKQLKKILGISPLGVYEYFRDRKKERIRLGRQTSIISNYMRDYDERKLQIGTGTNFLTGWLNTDLLEHDEIAYLDAAAAFPIASETFDYIYSEHLFEHLKIDEQINMLNESYRILKKNGILRIATPSLEFLHSFYAEPFSQIHTDYTQWYIEYMPGLRPVKNLVPDPLVHYGYILNNFFKAWGHQVIHNPDTLSKLALQCGYSEVKFCNVGESSFPALQNIEKHGTILPEWINLLETMVIEIKK